MRSVVLSTSLVWFAACQQSPMDAALDEAGSGKADSFGETCRQPAELDEANICRYENGMFAPRACCLESAGRRYESLLEDVQGAYECAMCDESVSLSAIVRQPERLISQAEAVISFDDRELVVPLSYDVPAGELIGFFVERCYDTGCFEIRALNLRLRQVDERPQMDLQIEAFQYEFDDEILDEAYHHWVTLVMPENPAPPDPGRRVPPAVAAFFQDELPEVCDPTRAYEIGTIETNELEGETYYQIDLVVDGMPAGFITLVLTEDGEAELVEYDCL